jgi:hypothetical protein
VPRIAAQRNEKPLNYGDNFALSRKARQRQQLGQGANAGVINRVPMTYLDSGNANGHEYPRRKRASFPQGRSILTSLDMRREVETVRRRIDAGAMDLRMTW